MAGNYVDILVNELLLNELEDAKTQVKELESILERRNEQIDKLNQKYLYEKKINESLIAELHELCGGGEE